MQLKPRPTRIAGPLGRQRHRRALLSSIAAIATAAALTACGGAAPTPPSQPTVQAAATQAVSAGVSAAGTAQAVASPVAATAVAAASPAAATAQAGAAGVAATSATFAGTAVAGLSPSSSPSPSPSPRPAAQAPVRIADASLADSTPWVSLQNTSNQAVDLGGWQLQVGSATAEIPEDAVVEPGSTLTLHAGTGANSEDELYLGGAGDRLALAAQPGAPVRLTDDRGSVVAEATVPRF
jgi:hypothetical protein